MVTHLVKNLNGNRARKKLPRFFRQGSKGTDKLSAMDDRTVTSTSGGRTPRGES